MAYRDIARRKKAEQDASIPQEWKVDITSLINPSAKSIVKQLDPPGAPPFWSKVLSERELEITTGNDAVDIVEGLKAETWSAEEVTTAFCKRAALAHQLTNCLTEMFFDRAIQRAKELDDARKASPETPLGPLWGLPVSLKDTYHVPGTDATIGFACFAFKPSTSYSPLAELLVSLGAVLYCKTTVPQTLMSAEPESNLFGRTINPHNTSLIAGGSTTGEGPLIALGGSVLGFGTDIGGSLRIPALCNGVYGFKPSVGIMPFSEQQMPFAPGWEGIGIVASAGPMASSVRACNLALETIMKAVPSDYDLACLRIPWVESIEISKFTDPRRLRIGIVTDDGLSTPTPPVKRAIEEATKHLREAGVAVVPVRLPRILDTASLVGKMFAVNGSKHVTELAESTGEPWIPSVERIGLHTWTPNSMSEYFDLNGQRYDILKTYNEFWRNENLDAIVMPVAPHTATPENTWASLSYTAIWNLLDCPSIVIPTGAVSEIDIVDKNKQKFHSANDEKMYRIYDGPITYKDAPTAIQLVGKKQTDQALMVIAGVVDKILR